MQEWTDEEYLDPIVRYWLPADTADEVMEDFRNNPRTEAEIMDRMLNPCPPEGNPPGRY